MGGSREKRGSFFRWDFVSLGFHFVRDDDDDDDDVDAMSAR